MRGMGRGLLVHLQRIFTVSCCNFAIKTARLVCFFFISTQTA
jgi:hypothetical protein